MAETRDTAFTRRVRAASRGLVIRDEHLLITVLRDDEGEWWLTPGGGQEFGESKVDNVAREVFEETGYRVLVGDLACGRDYIGGNHFSWDRDFQQTELWFWCELLDDQPVDPPGLDTAQTAVRWVRVDELLDAPFFPRRLAEWLQEDPATRPLWLGDVN